MPKKQYRIFLGLREMAGYMKGLQKGFYDLEIPTHFLDIGGSPFHYESAVNPAWLNKINRKIGRLASFSFRNFFLRLLWLGIFQNFVALFFFPWALLTHNVFIFCSNSTFFFYLELLLLKLCRKKVIYIFLGTESRPVYCSGKVAMETPRQIRWAKMLCRFQKLWIRYVELFSDCIISIPPQALFHEKPFVSILTVGYPCDLNARELQVPQPFHDRVRILHAPSHKKSKGTDTFRKIMEELKREGEDFDYCEIFGIPNQLVLKEIAKADFIIDELYSDTPLGGIATEAALLGRPAVIGSYYADDINDDVLPQKLPPSIFVHPDKIKEAIRKLIIDREFCKKSGLRIQEFVQRQWLPSLIAKNYLCLLNGDAPKEWLFHPKNCRYFMGCGISAAKLKSNIRAFCDAQSDGRALCLPDKTVLKNKIMSFSNEE